MTKTVLNKYKVSIIKKQRIILTILHLFISTNASNKNSITLSNEIGQNFYVIYVFIKRCHD